MEELTQSGPDHEDMIRRYLLGAELSAEDEGSVENLLFEGEGYLERFSVIEDELIESYLRNEISGEQRDLFNTRLRTSPRLSKRLEWIRSYMQMSSRSPDAILAVVGAPRAPASWWGLVEQSLRVSGRTVRAAVIICGLIGLGIGGFWISNQRQIANELQREVAEQRTQREQVDAQLRREELQHRALEGQLAKASANSFIAFVLAPADASAIGRGKAGKAQTMTIPAGARLIQFDLPLKRDGHASYRGVIETVEGQEVLSQNGLTSRRNLGRTVVIWPLLADALRDDDYIVTLSGVGKDGAIDLAESYFIRVKR